MIQGVVNAAYEPVISLTLEGPAGQTRDIQAVVDTGYTGFLTLPSALVAELQLPFVNTGWALLANDDEVRFSIHGVTVLWDGQPRDIEADVAGSVPLLGMRLLDQHNLNIDVERGGPVVINAKA